MEKPRFPFVLHRVDKYGDHVINSTTCYEYLGNFIDPSITLNMNFDKRYKNASSRIRLLGKVHKYLTVEASEKVYNTIIALLLTYCCIVKLPLYGTQATSLQSIEDRASKIVYGKSKMREVPSISRMRNIKACLPVQVSKEEHVYSDEGLVCN